MIDSRILSKLLPITEEERTFLEGNSIDRDFYKLNSNNIINREFCLLQGQLITIRPHPRFVDFPAHSHDYIEVVYMCVGSTVHIINGNRIVLNEGELLFLGANAVHEIKKASQNDIAVNFIILPQFFNKTLNLMDGYDTPLRQFLINQLGSKPVGGSYLHFRVSDILQVQNLVENLLITLTSDTQSRQYLNQTTMALLMLSLMDYAELLETEDKTDALIVEVLKYIEDSYVEGELSNLAKKMHCDHCWLSREIKRRTNKTFTQLMQEKRISQAMYLLRATKMNVTDIAVAVGYDNASYFHRLFVKNIGLTPYEYRSCK